MIIDILIINVIIKQSGGQNQKMAIARAIYKNTNSVILDEPTANLDTIAEYEIFTNFDNLVSHKTTIYISFTTNIFTYQILINTKRSISIALWYIV